MNFLSFSRLGIAIWIGWSVHSFDSRLPFLGSDSQTDTAFSKVSSTVSRVIASEPLACYAVSNPDAEQADSPRDLEVFEKLIERYKENSPTRDLKILKMAEVHLKKLGFTTRIDRIVSDVNNDGHPIHKDVIEILSVPPKYPTESVLRWIHKKMGVRVFVDPFLQVRSPFRGVSYQDTITIDFTVFLRELANPRTLRHERLHKFLDLLEESHKPNRYQGEMHAIEGQFTPYGSYSDFLSFQEFATYTQEIKDLLKNLHTNSEVFQELIESVQELNTISKQVLKQLNRIRFPLKNEQAQIHWEGGHWNLDYTLFRGEYRDENISHLITMPIPEVPSTGTKNQVVLAFQKRLMELKVLAVEKRDWTQELLDNLENRYRLPH